MRKVSKHISAPQIERSFELSRRLGECALCHHRLTGAHPSFEQSGIYGPLGHLQPVTP